MRLYRSSMPLLLLSMIACTSLPEHTILQTVELMQTKHFVEGASFDLIKQREGCLLQGTSYGESGKSDYTFYFDDKGITAAHYEESRYARPIYVDSNVKIVKTTKSVYKENSEENEAFEALFNDLQALITQSNLAHCF